ncbi:protein FAM83G [Bufo bufo]|uniref:protein FAM83G n=1 Tax=Bufo bufo TaxID=8384 RepID=UPI001ABEDA21|nr:protein FAM83G [Bufo bufo]
MALSQIQCLDHNNVNWRSSEGKPEFYYSEEQRLALEALVSSGQDSFHEVVKKENIRDFLSELELAKIPSRVEPFDPDTSHPRKSGDKSEQEGEEDPLDGAAHSLEYWPDRSDCSIPELDLGWPDAMAYRGVTRATVYMQPPIDGQPHIKEVVRKMITQAQRVIGLVMDLFTDVDIFKDLLDAGFKRRISVYIILNESDLKYFLQMCEKAQMHRGHLKNLRIRIVGGCEFYTRFSTRFRGSLGQKFMFVDGDKAMCGSYSFTWSAARIDRNLITVLTGQVVETFDRQFQELYLLSKGVSLKNVPMDNEPEPEPVFQPVSVPTGPSESIAKKMINPKYSLVTVKSSSDTGKDSKKGPEIAKKIPTKTRVPTFEHLRRESQIHPALQDMERADMFEYLPTWVEPDPEPGSDILGYINIIDPSIRNAQPSQMNRIKICDTSQATAEYLKQARENEMMKQQQQESSSSTKNDAGQPDHSRECGQNQSTTDRGSSNGQLSRQASQEHGSKAICTKSLASRQDSQDGTLASKAPREESSVEVDNIKKHDHKETATSEVQEIPSPQRSPEGIATLAERNHIVHRGTGPAPTGGKPPPMPKPRTMQVTDFISMKNSLNTKSLKASTSVEENTVPSVNGMDAEGREAEEIDILIENGPNDNDQNEDDGSMFRPCPGEYSSSGSGSLPPSNASSMSEEYYPSASLHRRSSERFSNGERPPPHRKLSDGHISRGSFLSPLSISNTLMEMNPSENGNRRTMLEDYVLSGNPLQRNERIYALDPSQGMSHFHYSTNSPSGGFDRFHSRPGTSRSVGKDRAKNESFEGAGAYRQIGRKSDSPGARTGYWSSKDYGANYTSPLSQSPIQSETVTTPFGIPYSRLSQAKHLKNKMGAGNLDSRRRGHGPPGHKDL